MIAVIIIWVFSLGIKAEDDLPEFVIIELEEDSDSEELQTDDRFRYPEYEEWGRATIDGKLKMKGLPLTPSIKVYMEEGAMIDMSVRAPFVGEAVRIEMTCDSITAVNKMNKTYVSEALPSGVGLVGMVQDLILGRFFLAGVDMNEADIEGLVDVYSNGGGLFNVVPKQSIEIEGVKYGYVVDNNFTPLMLAVLTGRMEVDATYIYKAGGYDIQFVINDGVNYLSPTLELKSPEWGVGKSNRLKIDNKYRKISLKDWIERVGR